MADLDVRQDMQGGSTISRRRFLAGVAVAPLVARGWLAGAAIAPQSNILLVGTQTTTAGSKGIYSYHWNATTGDMSAQVLAARVAMPTFLVLAPDGQHVYCVDELASGPGQVTGFVLNRAARTLAEINAVSTVGGGPAHLALDRTGRALFAANYRGGSAVSFQVASNATIGSVVENLKYTQHGPDKTHQASAHAHRVTVSPDNRFLLVNDLGGDAIHIYLLDAATAVLKPVNPPQWKATPGSGPRSLRFHPNGLWAYNVNQLDQTAELLSWNAKAGTLTSLQRVNLTSSLSTADAASESAIDSTGVFAYFAVRGADILVTCLIDAKTGRLTVLDRVPCGGRVPRHITLDPSEQWLLAANQGSGNISVFARDAKTGKLTPTAKHFPISIPQCLLFA